MGDRGRPEQNDVEAEVSDAVVTQGPGNATSEMIGTPGLVPASRSAMIFSVMRV
jgi:hypothetical protein